MSETQVQTLKRRKSGEELRHEEQAAFDRGHTKATHTGLEGEFRRLVEDSRSGFFGYQVWLCLMLLSLFIGMSQPLFIVLALVCLVCSVVSFQRAVLRELRGSYEAGVIVLIKAIEGRAATPVDSLAEQASQVIQIGSLEAERQQRLRRQIQAE